MIRTLRTPISAGAVASLCAAAMLTAAPGGADRLLATPSNTPVALAAWQNPIVALLDSGEMAENYVFGSYYNGADSPTPGAGEANWPSAGFDQTGGDVLNYLLYNQAELGNYSYVGFLENFAASAYLPAVQQLQFNIEDYISVVLSGLNRGARALAMGQWADAVTSVRDAATYVLSNLSVRAQAVVAAIPQILTTFAGWAVGSVRILAQETAAIVTGVVSNLSTGNIEGVWNTAVDGLLGPSGIMGALLNLTTGAGVQTGAIVNPVTDIPGNFVPSFRTAVQSAQWTVRTALETVPAPMGPPAASVRETLTGATDSPVPAASRARSAVAAPRAVASEPGAANRDGARRAAATDRAERVSRADRARS